MTNRWTDSALRNERDVIGPTIRFIPGAVLGVAVGFWLVVDVRDPTPFFGVIVLAGVVGGLLSARYGLRFWEALRDFHWFLP